MILSFTLSMPNIGSWNGKWTGEGNLYARTRSFKRSDAARGREILDIGYFRYNWNDGWSAAVSVKEVSSSDAAKIRKHTRGFCGYDWMIDSIISKLLIEIA
jgi:hypothetical protein